MPTIEQILADAGLGQALGNATAAQVLTGYSFSSLAVIGKAGAMPNNGAPTWTPGAQQSITPGYYSGGTISAIAHGSQQFTASGTFTVPTGVTQIMVVCIGGGGGGGGAAAGSASGGGGGAGGMAINVISVSAGQQYAVTVGGGGAGGAGSTPANGSAGASSTFGTALTGDGGTGGYSSTDSSYAGNGAGSAGGLFNNEAGWGLPGTTVASTGPLGGQSPWGYGNGGLGAPASASAAVNGTAGTAGIVQVWW